MGYLPNGVENETRVGNTEQVVYKDLLERGEGSRRAFGYIYMRYAPGQKGLTQQYANDWIKRKIK